MDKQTPIQRRSLQPVPSKPEPPPAPPSAKDDLTSPKDNTYFANIAKNLRIAFYTTIVGLVAIIFFGLAAFSSEITTTNVQHLVRAFSIAFSPSGTDEVVFAYDSDSHMAFAAFGLNFAVATTRGVTLFDRMGNTAFRNQQTFTNPQIVSAVGVNGRMLVYDRGGFGYAVYDSFGLRHSVTNAEFPVFSATVAGNGTFAIATRNRINRSEIFVYNHNFSRMTGITNSGHIMALELSPDGQYLLMVFANTNEMGQGFTDIRVFYIASAYEDRAMVFEKQLVDTMPFTARFNDSGGITVLLSTGLLFLNSEYNIIDRYDFGERNYTEFYVGYGMSAIIYREAVLGNQNAVLLFDNYGEMILQSNFVGRISRKVISGEYLYIAVTGRLYRFHVSGVVEYAERESGLLAMVPLPDGEILLCYAGRAFRAEFGIAEYIIAEYIE